MEKMFWVLLIISILMLGCLGQNIEKTPNLQMQNQSRSQNKTTVQESRAETKITNSNQVMNSETVFPTLPKYNFDNITNESGDYIIYYFYLPKCAACIANRPKIDELEQKYPMFEWREYDLSTQNGTFAYFDFAQKFNKSKTEITVPQILVNNTIFENRINIDEKLEKYLEKINSN
jgi:thiol-disulfide isomerase/thioredoxin